MLFTRPVKTKALSRSRPKVREQILGSNSRRPCQKTTQGKSLSIFDPRRWAVYDIEYQESDGRKVSKIAFIMYSPDDNADNTEKFVVACNKDAVKAKLQGTNLDFQINAWDELKEDEFIAKFSK